MMKFNEMSEIANAIWDEIPRQFPYAELGVYQVMPNHVHGIIVIYHTKCWDLGEKRDDGDAKDGGTRGCRDANYRVSSKRQMPV